MTQAGRVAALVLAAGTGSRFGGGKMTALLDGMTLPAHVVGAARSAGLERIAVVLGRDAGSVAAALDGTTTLGQGGGGGDAGSADGFATAGDARPVATAGEARPAPILRVINPTPERGLSSSLRIGIAVATAAPTPDAVLILLGDQPRVRADVIAALLAIEPPADVIAVVPLYDDDAAPNPVLLLPAGFALVARADGDRGLGALLAAAGSGVVRVPVNGANPDVDTLADLASLAAPSTAGRRSG